MAGPVSAGTFIGAALETAGYVTQSQIYKTLEPLMRSGGYLIVLMSMMFALLSIALSGNSKLIRYFIFGPTLFAFMVFTPGALPGAIWRLGGGTPRTLTDGQVTEAEALKASRLTAVEGIVDKTEREEILNARDYEVALPFQLMVRAIDGTVRTVVDLILRHENDKNLLFIARTRAYDVLLNSLPEQPRVLSMFRGDFLDKCSDLVLAARNLTAPQFNTKFETAIRVQAASQTGPERASYDQQLEAIQRGRIYWQQKYDQALVGAKVRPNAATLDFIRETSQESNSAASRIMSEVGGTTGSNQLTCGQMWKLSADAITRDSELIAKQLEKSFTGPLETRDKKLLCVQIAQKLGRDVGVQDQDRCDLTEAVSVALLRNIIGMRSDSALVQQMKSRMEIVESSPNGHIALAKPDLNPDDYELVGGQSSPQFKMGTFAGMASLEGATKQQLYAKYRNKKTNQEQFEPVFILSELSGDWDLAFNLHQRTSARGLRQKIFSYAINLPYWQGSLLYFLGAIYPIFCLVLLIPGRAASFLAFPLFWLWIKSWDIGFAICMVLDQVLWNMIPATDFDQNSASAMKLQDNGLSGLLTETFKIDPVYNTHAYYFIMSIVMLAIPAITGYMTVKGRRSMISGFTEMMGRNAADGEEKANQVYMAADMDQQNKYLKQMEAMSKLTALNNTKTYSGAEMTKAAEFWGGLQTLGDAGANIGNAATGQILSALQTGKVGGFFNGKIAGEMIGARESFAKNSGEWFSKFAKNEAEYQAAFGSYGRHGELQQLLRTRFATYDSYTSPIGGFDIPDILTTTKKTAEAHRDLLFEQVQSVFAASAKLSTTPQKLIGAVPKGNFVAGMAASVPALLNVLNTYGKYVPGAPQINDLPGGTTARGAQQQIYNGIGSEVMNNLKPITNAVGDVIGKEGNVGWALDPNGAGTFKSGVKKTDAPLGEAFKTNHHETGRRALQEEYKRKLESNGGDR